MELNFDSVVGNSISVMLLFEWLGFLMCKNQSDTHGFELVIAGIHCAVIQQECLIEI